MISTLAYAQSVWNLAQDVLSKAHLGEYIQLLQTVCSTTSWNCSYKQPVSINQSINQSRLFSMAQIKTIMETTKHCRNKALALTAQRIMRWNLSVVNCLIHFAGRRLPVANAFIHRSTNMPVYHLRYQHSYHLLHSLFHFNLKTNLLCNSLTTQLSYVCTCTSAGCFPRISLAITASAMQTAVIATGCLPSVRPSVCPSRSGVLSRRMKIRSCGLQH